MAFHPGDGRALVEVSQDHVQEVLSDEVLDRLLGQARVAVVPGVAFGLDEHIRLSYAVSMEQIEEGLKRIAEFLA